MNRSIIALTCLLTLLVLYVPTVHAQTVLPSFPSCISPVGSLKADNNGTHGIAGDTVQYTGNDKVYTLSDSTLIQCFCPASGTGIQTNWLKISELSQSEIDTFKMQGWIFIPDGSAWGLDASNYLAFNLNFNCNGGGQTQGDSSNNTGTGGTNVGQVLGAAIGGGDVLGLAGTGTSIWLVSLLVVGLTALLAGLYLRQRDI